MASKAFCIPALNGLSFVGVGETLSMSPDNSAACSDAAAVAAARPGSASGYKTLGPEHAREPAAGGGGYEAYSAAEIAAAVAAQAGKDAARPYAALVPHAVYGGTGGIGDTAV